MASSSEELDEIRRRVDIVTLIESFGAKLFQRPSKVEYAGLCPFHKDIAPSFNVNREKGVWHCKSGCGGGDCFEFVKRAKNLSFREAKEWLMQQFAGYPIAQPASKPACPIESSADDQEQLYQVALYYHERLRENAEAIAYLESRGLNNAEAIARFQIGFCDRTLGLTIPSNQYKAGREQRERLTRLGVMKETGHEALRGCVTFPVATGDNQVGEIYGRRILRSTPKNERHWYLSGPHVGVWNASAFQHESKEIILCEGIIDALTFWIAGFRNATCTYGKSGFTEEIFNAFITNGIQRCYVSFDNDENDPEDRCAAKVAQKLMSRGIECLRIDYPHHANDTNSYAMKLKDGNGSSHGPLQHLINQAVPMSLESRAVSREENQQPAPKEEIVSEAEASAKATVVDLTSPATLLTPAEQPSLLDAKPGVRDHASDSSNQPSANTLKVPEQGEALQTLPQPSSLTAQISDNEVLVTIGNRSYRIRGLSKTSTYDTMKVNLLVRKGEQFYVDTLDLYQSRQRASYIREAAREIELEEESIKRDLGKLLQKLEEIQHEQSLVVESKEKPIEISDEDRAKALELLRSPNLIERVVADFNACGVVGEETNKIIGYLAATSRKLSQPLAVLIQSSSAAGKSSLMEAVLSFMPPEDQIKYSAMTGQSLFYMGATNLKHRILAIAEEEGVEQAAYALKLLQSEGKLNIASTGKDPGTGRMETQEYHVEGPVMIFLTTTSDETDPELKNRCVVLGVCEHACHTEAIHHQQRNKRTLGGQQLQFERRAIRTLHQNAQRLLRPLCVVNNYANQLTFRTDKTKSRRAHEHYLTLIESITLLHQYQRTMKSMEIAGEPIEYIETTLEDIELANKLADRFLERSFAELPERTNVLLEQILGGVRNLAEFQAIELGEVHFTRKDVRRWSTFGDTQLKQHLARLVDYEYLKVEPSKDRGRTIVYSLAYDPANNPTMKSESGLVDVNRLRVTDASDKVGSSAGQEPLKVGGSSDKVGPSNSASFNENVDDSKNDALKGENDRKGAA